MSETKFTPGPWTLKSEGWEGQFIWGVDDRVPNLNRYIASVDLNFDGAEANAALIAAAPDLYAELENLVTELERLWEGENANDLHLYEAEDWEQKQEGKWLANIETAKAALTKARGEGV